MIIVTIYSVTDLRCGIAVLLLRIDAVIRFHIDTDNMIDPQYCCYYITNLVTRRMLVFH